MTTFEPCRQHAEIHDHRGWCVACELTALREERKRLMEENAALKRRVIPAAPCQPLYVVSQNAIERH